MSYLNSKTKARVDEKQVKALIDMLRQFFNCGICGIKFPERIKKKERNTYL